MTDNDIKKGLKLYKKLNVPDFTLDVENDVLKYLQGWNMINSVRAQGKTTNILLYGMCLNAVCGVQIQYIRRREDQLAPKYAKDAFKVIEAPGYKYVDKITGGRYNGIVYKARRWYYVLRDDDFKIIEQAPEPFCVCLSLDNNERYKSVYNAPLGDYIVFDEYITRDSYLDDEFILLMDVLKTIIRLRTTAVIFMLGNMVDMHCPYFGEFDVIPIIKDMQYGDHRIINSAINTNTKMHIYLQPTAKTQAQKDNNNKYFGWRSNKLSTITGVGAIWEMSIYPRAPKGDYTILDRAYIYYQERMVCREIRKADDDGHIYLFLYDSNAYIPQAHILYRSDPDFTYNSKVRYGLGYTKTDNVVKQLINNNRVCYANNSVGEFLRSYVRSID